MRLGDVVAGNYRVERLLGRGGMGMVVAARHVHLGERVAVKLLLPGSPVTPRAFARFVREGRAAARMRSEHAARVRDVGALSTGEPYLVLEYLHGVDLRTLLRKRGPFPIDAAVALVLQVCDALAEAHSLGIVHRDLKPANLFLTRRPDGSAAVKIIDFGISKVTAEDEEEGSAASLTAHGAAVGTPGYMAPEQMRSARTADARADIWSLGAVLYGLLAGASPFHGETMIDVYDRILKGTPSLRAARPDAPAEIEEAVSRCLRTDPAERYQDVAQLASALRAAVPPARCAAALRALGDEIPDPCAGDPSEPPGDPLPLATTDPDPLGLGPPSEPAPTATPREPSWAERRRAHETLAEAPDQHPLSAPERAAPRSPHDAPESPAAGLPARPRRPLIFAASIGVVLTVSGAAFLGLRSSAPPPSAPSPGALPPPLADSAVASPAQSAPDPASSPSAPASAPPSAPASPTRAASESALPPPPAALPRRPAPSARRPVATHAPSASAATDLPGPARPLPGISDTPD